MSNKKKQKKNKKPDKEPKLLTWLTIMNGIVLMLQGLTTLVDKLIELIDHIYKMLSDAKGGASYRLASLVK